MRLHLPQPGDNSETLFSLAGAACRLSSNSATLIRTIQSRAEPATDRPICDFRIDVSFNHHTSLGTPHFRGMRHFVVATFGRSNIFLFDLIRNCITAKVSAPTIRDHEFWHRTLLPIAAGVCGASIGVLPVHSACLSRHGNALLIAGESGAGKSTLAAVLAQRGFDYVADDWTYCTLTDNSIMAHGMDARIKLLPDAIHLFPALHGTTPQISMNGELAFEIDPATSFAAQVQRHSRPRALLFLSRSGQFPAAFTRLAETDARRYLEENVERLPAELDVAQVTRNTLIHAVARLPCWRLDCGGSPNAIAEIVETFYDEQETTWHK